MLIEQIPQFNLDQVNETDQFVRWAEGLEQGRVPLVSVSVPLDWWEGIPFFIGTLRSANVSVILQVKKLPNMLLDEGQMKHVFSSLRDWDQMLLSNFMELCEERVPEHFRASLKTEAKFELKWFAEWLTASSDFRIHRYPGLPWRSFVRKINRENFEFASLVLSSQVAEVPGDLGIDDKIKQFLEEKKKVVCVFPKRWNGGKA
jgi:hypothetical protein